MCTIIICGLFSPRIIESKHCDFDMFNIFVSSIDFLGTDFDS